MSAYQPGDRVHIIAEGFAEAVGVYERVEPIHLVRVEGACEYSGLRMAFLSKELAPLDEGPES